MKIKSFFIALSMLFFLPNSTFAQTKTYADLSKRLLTAVRHHKDVSAMIDSIKNVAPEILAEELNTDDAKKAFWVNVYNANIQIILSKNPGEFENNRSQFFQKKQFYVAHEYLSFEGIEHGIIRRSKARLGLGIFPKFFPGKFERKMRAKKVDPRVHFALNCGAKSCPPVAIYDYHRTEEQLKKMSINHLKKHSTYNEAENTVYVPKLMQWFSGDFGLSKRKKRRFLVKHGAIPKGTKPAIKFDPYDWTLFLDNFVDV